MLCHINYDSIYNHYLYYLINGLAVHNCKTNNITYGYIQLGHAKEV